MTPAVNQRVNVICNGRQACESDYRGSGGDWPAGYSATHRLGREAVLSGQVRVMLSNDVEVSGRGVLSSGRGSSGDQALASVGLNTVAQGRAPLSAAAR